MKKSWLLRILIVLMTVCLSASLLFACAKEDVTEKPSEEPAEEQVEEETEEEDEEINSIFKISTAGKITGLTHYGSTLKELSIPSSVNGVTVTAVADFAFAYNYNVEEITIPSGVNLIGRYAFACCFALKEVNIPATVTELEDHAFYGCYDLEIIDTSNLVKIGGYAFAGLNKIVSVNLASATSIGASAFENCAGIETLSLGNYIQTIGDSAFKNCSSITGTITINGVLEDNKPKTVISASACEGCSNVLEISLGRGISSIGENAFFDTGITTARYAGTKEDWAKISLGENYLPSSVTQIICSDRNVDL